MNSKPPTDQSVPRIETFAAAGPVLVLAGIVVTVTPILIAPTFDPPSGHDQKGKGQPLYSDSELHCSIKK